MKKISLACERFKLERFKKELADLGYTDLEIHEFGIDLCAIKFSAPWDRLREIERMCTRVQLHFNQGN